MTPSLLLHNTLTRSLEPLAPMDGSTYRFYCCHVRNVTDVDDKTIRESQKAGMTLEAFTSRWQKRVQADCAALQILLPHVEPSAVAHIGEQIRLIEKLLQENHAYRAEDGSIYYRIASFPEYG